MSQADERLPARAMKVTTVRFGADLWTLLEHEAALAGVSVAQYVREAALAPRRSPQAPAPAPPSSCSPPGAKAPLTKSTSPPDTPPTPND